ncbi:hypothetical protein [Algoriphagus sp.]|uniref:hypothetical protein n=1 Tax=Algoriphagus sp. TaxID=1872435 RepID=UPI00391BE0D4
MNNELERKSEELQQTLAKQLELFKKDSEEWLKLGAVVAVGALLTYGIVKVASKKKAKSTDKALDLLEREGLLSDDIKDRLTKSNKSTFWPGFTQRLIILGLALAKDRIYDSLFSPAAEENEEGERGQ